MQAFKSLQCCKVLTWSHHFMANRWGKMEMVTDFIFLGSKITADGDCSHEIKRHLLLGREAMTNLDSILKSRDIILPTKVHIVKAIIFPVVAQTVKHPPTMLENWVRSLGWEDPLEKEMATHSSTLAWKIPWTEEPGRLQSMGSQGVRHNGATVHTHKLILWFSIINALCSKS